MVKLALCLTLTLILCAVAASAAQAAGVYVALGDSYTSAPLVPNQHGQPIDCGRSDHNYPSLVAQEFKPDEFIDVSCGSAETKHMTEPQTDLPAGGTNPPQFNALRADATLVTVGIGGNDAGLVGVAEKCAELGVTNPNGTACRDYWAPGGNDQVAAKIEAAKPKIAGVLQGIHQRSPQARVAIVGYPDVTPKNGESCYPMVPLSPDDIRYIDELIIRINAMIAGQAAANDARVRRHLQRQRRPRRLQAAAGALVRGARADRAGLPAASERQGRGEHGPLGDRAAGEAAAGSGRRTQGGSSGCLAPQCLAGHLASGDGSRPRPPRLHAAGARGR